MKETKEDPKRRQKQRKGREKEREKKIHSNCFGVGRYVCVRSWSPRNDAALKESFALYPLGC